MHTNISGSTRQFVQYISNFQPFFSAAFFSKFTCTWDYLIQALPLAPGKNRNKNCRGKVKYPYFSIAMNNILMQVMWGFSLSLKAL
jgi:hypothetical protein